jgi:ERCC4-related helicase
VKNETEAPNKFRTTNNKTESNTSPTEKTSAATGKNKVMDVMKEKLKLEYEKEFNQIKGHKTLREMIKRNLMSNKSFATGKRATRAFSSQNEKDAFHSFKKRHLDASGNIRPESKDYMNALKGLLQS